jgi:hypothetical protein
MVKLREQLRAGGWSRTRRGAQVWLVVGLVGLLIGAIGLISENRTAGHATIALVGVMLVADAIATLSVLRWPNAAAGLRIVGFAAAAGVIVSFLGDVTGRW